MAEFRLPNKEDEMTIIKSIRLRKKDLDKIKEVSAITGLSENKIIMECIIFALANLVINE